MASTKQPNVLLLMTDQQRWDAVGCSGNSAIDTVNIDALSTDGTIFTAAYSATPSCVPARASLMTGMDAWHTGILGMGPGQPPCGNLSNTLPEVLSAAGYHTQGVGKMHFLPQRSLQGFHSTVLDESRRVFDPGFSSDYAQWFERNKPGDVGRYDHGIDFNSWMARPYHLPEHLHATNWTANEAIRALQHRDPTRPFFLKASFARPHSPYDPPPYYFDMYAERDLPPAAVGEWASIHDVPGTDPNAWQGRRSSDEIHRARAGYYGSVTHIDHQIGRITRYLRDQRLYDETLIIFTSDHGDMLGDHNLWRKTYAYEGSAHVPLIVRLPASMRGDVAAQSSRPVALQDIMPTILDAVGASIPSTVDGRSLMQLFRGDESEWREYIHGEHSMCYDVSAEMQYLTDGRWKYIWFPRTGREQLFDLSVDPYECDEITDVAALEPWRRRLVDILEPRKCGLVESGRLVRVPHDEPIVSPNAVHRVS